MSKAMASTFLDDKIGGMLSDEAKIVVLLFELESQARNRIDVLGNKSLAGRCSCATCSKMRVDCCVEVQARARVAHLTNL